MIHRSSLFGAVNDKLGRTPPHRAGGLIVSGIECLYECSIARIERERYERPGYSLVPGPSYRIDFPSSWSRIWKVRVVLTADTWARDGFEALRGPARADEPASRKYIRAHRRASTCLPHGAEMPPHLDPCQLQSHPCFRFAVLSTTCLISSGVAPYFLIFGWSVC
jgi:hypothetical protein